ncbi:MAG: carbonic anhydrase [Candidatus Acidiferrum sp.]
MTERFKSNSECEKFDPEITDSFGEDEIPARLTNDENSRRDFLRMALCRTVSGFVVATGAEFAGPYRALAQSALTPQQAMDELIAGNKRFLDEKLTSFEHDLTILKKHTIDKQEPFAAVLSCADSRVPVELIFDQSIGHIFVTRIAGNIATSEIIASLEYGAAVLETKVILVMGHAGCGAVKATIQAKEVPGQISALYPHIQPAVDRAGSDLEAVSKANAKIQAALLRQSSTVIAELIKDNKLKVSASYYDVGTGAVTILD